ncbi:MAG: SdrD B-like domain-containing protein, partial [Cyanobacteria bacterium J06598_4]
MPSNPNVTLGQLPNPFIGESIDLTLSFDNTGDAIGYGPFMVLFLDQTGTDGDVSTGEINDGLTFTNASYLGSDITITQIDLTSDGLPDGSYKETVTIHGGDYDVTVPDGFVAGDSLVVFELPFGSFVTSQPTADISVSLDSSELADLNEPLNIVTQGGFVFGDSETGQPGINTILGSSTSGSVLPQLVTLQKNYLGPEDETATGPNFKQQYEVVVNIAPDQTIENLDISDILPNTMQFVRVVSIEDKNGVVDPSRITEVSTPDDGGLGSIGGDNYDAGNDDVPVVGGTVTRRIDAVEGSVGDRDLVMVVEFFVPRLDAAGNAIIDANTADDVFDQNESELGNNAANGNTWQPKDLRDTPAEIFIPRTTNDGSVADNFPNATGTENDGGDAFNNPDEVLEEQAIAIQKSVRNVGGSGEFKPGDVLEYTIEFQVSDYFAFEDVIVNDTFSDGQRFDANFAPVLSFDEHATPGVAGAEFSSVANLAVNYTPVGNNLNDVGAISTSDFVVINETDINNPATSDGSGNTGLRFDVSGLLNTQAGQDNKLVGGGIPDGGFNGAALNNNPPLNTGFGGTTGTIKFRTVVQDAYSDNFPSGDPSVDSSDRLQNTATINGAVLNVDNLSPDASGNREADDTGTEISIASGNLYKSIYAINGVVAGGAAGDTNISDGVTGYVSGVEVDPGDEITYRLTFQLPVSDVEQLTLKDFFPLPAYDAAELAGLTIADINNSRTDGDLTSVPLAGKSEYGPLHDFAKDVEGLTVDAAGNSFLYNFGTFDDPDNKPAIVDVLVTATIQDEPVADGLVYTNQVSQAQQNTFNEPDGRDAIVQINLRQPDVSIAKDFRAVNGVVGGDRNALEAGDIVTFSVTLENTGSSTRGAFDAKINDLIPQGFIVPTNANGINVTATYGDNTTVNSRGGNLTFSDAVNNVGGQDEIEIELVDDGEGTATTSDDFGALEGTNNPGKNQITVTYDLEVSEDLSSIYDGTDSIITNIARATFANINDGQEFSEIEDDAEVSVLKPLAQKKFVTSSEGSTNGQNVTIGEIVRYRLIAEMPEGVSKNVILRDQLPGGLRFLNDDTAKIGFVSTSSGLDSSTLGDNHIVGDESNLDAIPSSDISLTLPDGSITNDLATDSDTYFSGTDVFFKLGDITNSDRDNTNEFVVVEFNALVDNRSGGGSNDAGDRRGNRVSLFSDDANGNSVEHSESSNVTLKILEPQIAIDKKVEDPDNPGTFIDTTASTAIQADTGDDITFQTTFTNAGTDATTAFDVVMTDALPADLTLDLNSISAVDSNGTAVNLITTSSSGNSVIVNVDELPVGETITVTYAANIGSSVTPEQAITSTAEVEYTSLPGTKGTTTNDTGSSTPGNPGTPRGERNGDGGVNGDPNDFFAADAGHVKAPPLEPIKTIVATSEAATSEADAGVGLIIDPANGADPVEPRDVTIGEIVRYRLEVGIPEGTIPDFKITDVLPAGLRYLDDNTTKVAFLSNGSGVTSDTLGGTPQANGVSGDGTIPTETLAASAISGDGGDGFDTGEAPIFSLGEITNVDSDSDGESIVIEFNALVENVIANQDGLVLNNSFQVDTSAADATTKTSNSASVEILEPVINNVVHTANPTTGDADDTITYSVAFSNTGNTTAFDVNVSDLIVAQLDDRNIANVIVERTSNGITSTLSAGTDFQFTGGSSLAINFDELAVGDAIEITYEADITDTVSPDLTINNTAKVVYSSLPGTVGTVSNPTGSATPGASGTIQGERSGTNNALNNYVDSDNSEVDTPGLNPIKSIVATSETSTSEIDDGSSGNHRDVTIGEIVRYRLVVEIPEGTIENLELTDSLPRGLRYLDDGSAEVALIADDPGQISSSDTSIGSIAGNETNLDSIDLTDTITPAGGAFGSGTDPVFSLGTITNVDDDTHDGTLTPSNVDNKEFAVVEFNAVVENLSTTQDGTINATPSTRSSLSNDFTARADNAATKSSNRVTVEVLEPEINDVVKTATPSTGDADDTIAFRVNFSNTGTTSAFDVVLTESLAAGEIDNLDFNNIVITRNGTQLLASEFVNTSDANNLNISINEVKQGEAIAVSYSADIINTIDPDYSFDNTTDLTYSTLPGTGTASNPTGSATPGASGDADGERNGVQGVAGTLNNYADSGTTTLNTPGLAAVKSIVATSESSTAETDNGITDPRDLTIGEVVRYRLLVELPEGEIDNLQLTDTLPAGLKYLADGSAEVGLVADDPTKISSSNGAIASLTGNQTDIDSVNLTSAITPTVIANGADTQLVFDLGTVLNNDDEDLALNNKEYAVVEFNAVVENILSTQDGTIDDPATGRTEFINNGFVASADNAIDKTSNAVEVEVLEPEIIDVVKTATPSTPDLSDADDTIAFGVTFSNTGATSAFDVRLTDDNLTGNAATDELDNLDFNNITVTRNGTAIAANEFVNNSTATNFDISINEVAKDDVIVISYNADIIGAINPDYSFDNTTDLTYSTLPGTGTPVNTASDPTTNLTGSATPGASGAADGERNGAIGAAAGDLNNYADSDQTTLQTPGLAAVKSIVATSESSTAEGDNGIADPKDLTIGEVVRYRLLVEIPEGQINDLQVTDLLPTGLEYLNDGSAKAALVANDTAEISSTDLGTINLTSLAGDENSIDSVDPTTDITPGTSSVADGTELVFNLGDILNNDNETYDPNGDKEYVVVEYNAVVNNLATTQDGIIDNSPTAISNFSVDAANADPKTSNNVAVEVLEPEIINVAQAIAPTTGDAEDTIALQVDFSNTGSTSAFDVRVTDDLATDKFDNLDINNIVITRNPGTPGAQTLTAGVDFVNNSTGTNLDISINEVAKDDSIQVIYNADIINTIAPNSTIATTANVTYTTLPGSGTPINATGSVTPGATGTVNGERNGADGAAGSLNNYADSDGASLTTPGLIPTKVFVSTSEPSTDDRNNNGTKDVAIGEVVRYRLLVDLPEGQINNLKVEDILPTGLKYLNDGSAKVALVADNLADISFVDVGANPPAIANPNTDPTVRIQGNQSNIANITPTKAINAQDAAGNAFDPDNDTNPVFNLGSILNNDDEALAANNKEYTVLEFNAIVENIATNQDGLTLANNFTITYDNNQSVTTPNSVDVEIVEPNISNVLKEASVEDADAGEEVEFTITYTNSGNTTAFEVNLFDQPPSAEIENIRSVQIASSINNLDTVTQNSSASLVDLTIASVAPGEQITVTYQADLVADLIPGSTVTNTAKVTYTSLPNEGTPNTSTANNPTGSDAPGVSGAPDGERNGNDVDGVDDATDLNNYGGISTDTIDIINLSVGSTVFEDTNNNGVQDIGEGGIGGVELELYDDNGDRVLDPNGNPVTTTTDANGNYLFTQLPTGRYQILIPGSNFVGAGALVSNTLASANADPADNEQDGDSNGSQLSGAGTVVSSPIIDLAVNSEPLNDKETEPDGTSDDANDNDSDLTIDFGFVPVGQIQGNVSADVNNDGAGEDDLSGITLTLVDDNNATVATVTTDNDGNYTFANVLAGDYTVEQTQPTGFGNVSEQDSVDDGAEDNDVDATANDNILNVSLAAKEIDTGNDFVEVEYGRIAGNVSEDTDNNDTGDRDLVGIDLELLNSANQVIRTVQTDSNGNYEFTNLFPGQYKVRQVNRTGYGDVSEFDSNTNSILDGDRETANLNNDNLLDVNLVAGEADLGNDFVDRLGRISGNVKVDDDDDDLGDRNLGGVTVELLDRNNNNNVIRTTVTDGDGNYEFKDLVAGNYQVVQTNLTTDYGDVRDADGDTNNSLNQIDITLAAGQTSINNDFVDELGHISGNVKVDDDNDDLGDRNLAEVTIRLISGGTEIATTTTDSNGNYAFDDVLPGTYQIEQTNLTGYGDVTTTVLNVTLNPGETSANNNFVDELGRISGNVKVDDDNDDSGDRNLAGITINLIDSLGNTVSTTTDSAGNYLFEDVIAGDYTIVQENDPDFVDVNDVQGANDSQISVTVAPGQNVTGQSFVDEIPASIAGNVSRDDDNDDAGDRNLAGIIVNLIDNNAGVTVATQTTDATGNYLFEDVTPGNYTVEQINDPNFEDVTDVQGANDSQITVNVGIGESVTAQDFVDEIPASIAGNVSRDNNNDDLGDVDLSGITVNLIDANGNTISVNTDADGNYLFEDVTPGNYTIIQENAPNFADVTDVQGANDSQIALTVAVGETVVAQNFVDEIPASIAGNVSQDDNNDDAGDKNLAGITVNLIDNAGVTVATQTTDADGNYLFVDVTPGDYTIVQENDSNFVDVADVQGANDSQIALNVAIGETVVAQNFVDEIPASIAGNVSRDDDNDDDGDRNLAGITVTLNDGAGNVLTTTTDANGNYLFEDVTPGNYTITQENDTDFIDVNDVQGANDSQIALSVAIGETVAAQNFVDEVPASISGNVSQDENNDDAGERNLAGITVNLIDIAGVTVATQTTDADGNYLFTDVTPGDYTIEQVNDPNFVDVTDVQGANDSEIVVSVAIGETVTAQNFVDEIPASISGNVSRDDDNDDAGERNLADITVNLI